MKNLIRRAASALTVVAVGAGVGLTGTTAAHAADPVRYGPDQVLHRLTTPFIAVDGDGNLFAADDDFDTYELSDGTSTRLPSSQYCYGGVAVDQNDAVYEPCSTGVQVWRQGHVDVLPGSYNDGWHGGLAVDSSGNVFEANQDVNTVTEISNGQQTVLPFTGLGTPWGVAVDSSGNVYVCDYDNNRVLELSNGQQRTVPITGLSRPDGIAVDSADNVYVVSGGTKQVFELSDGHQSTLPFTSLSGVSPSGVAVDNNGDVFVTDYNSGDVIELPVLQGPSPTTMTPKLGNGTLCVQPAHGDDATQGDPVIVEPCDARLDYQQWDNSLSAQPGFYNIQLHWGLQTGGDGCLAMAADGSIRLGDCDPGDPLQQWSIGQFVDGTDVVRLRGSRDFLGVPDPLTAGAALTTYPYLQKPQAAKIHWTTD